MRSRPCSATPSSGLSSSLRPAPSEDQSAAWRRREV
jgi:hypothetical protein